jgi:hypothetical protein
MGLLPQHLLNPEAREEALRTGRTRDLLDASERLQPAPGRVRTVRLPEWKSDQYIVLDRFAAY